MCGHSASHASIVATLLYLQRLFHSTNNYPRHLPPDKPRLTRCPRIAFCIFGTQRLLGLPCPPFQFWAIYFSSSDPVEIPKICGGDSHTNRAQHSSIQPRLLLVELTTKSRHCDVSTDFGSYLGVKVSTNTALHGLRDQHIISADTGFGLCATTPLRPPRGFGGIAVAEHMRACTARKSVDIFSSLF